MASSSSRPLQNIQVWNATFQKYFEKFLLVIRDYRIIAIDTEFTGILEKLRFYKKNEVYAQMKSNIEAVKCIQIGFACSKEDGSLPCNENGIPQIWNFNLQFNENTDEHFKVALALLTSSGGLNLRKHAKHGILTPKFCRAMLSSNLLLRGDVRVYDKTWVTYSGNYDMGHCVKIFQSRNVLPNDRFVFGDMIRSYFGERMYDVKLMLAYRDLAYGKMKLEEVAARFGVVRIGDSHEAGSDALVTLKLYHIFEDVGW